MAGCTPDARSDPESADPRIEDVTIEEVANQFAECARLPPQPGAVLERPCVRIVYVWSSSMPLSEVGVPEIRAATEALGVELSVLRDRELVEPSGRPEAERLRGALVSAGATVHYPSVALVSEGVVRGPAVAGFKRADAYRSLLAARIAGVRGGAVESAEAPPALMAVADASIGSTPRPGQEVRVLWSLDVSPAPGAFFRRVPGTTFISYDQRRRVHLHDLASDERFVGPGWIDFVPTPDGRLFVTPGRAGRGLEFYDAADVFRLGLAGQTDRYEAVFVDGDLVDQYPSTGILAEDAERSTTRYRVLVSWFSGLAFRDYDVSRRGGGAPRMTPVGPRRRACPDLELSTPILSRDGREVAARDDRAGTTKVFRLEDDGACEELFDIGRRTSKVGFNDDGSLIAYSSPAPATPGRVAESTTYVLDRRDMTTTAVPSSESVGLVVPELIGPDSLLISVRSDPREDAAEFRLLCCVR